MLPFSGIRAAAGKSGSCTTVSGTIGAFESPPEPAGGDGCPGSRYCAGGTGCSGAFKFVDRALMGTMTGGAEGCGTCAGTHGHTVPTIKRTAEKQAQWYCLAVSPETRSRLQCLVRSSPDDTNRDLRVRYVVSNWGIIPILG